MCKEKIEIRCVRNNGIVGKPSFSNEIVQKGIQVIGEVVFAQGSLFVVEDTGKK